MKHSLSKRLGLAVAIITGLLMIAVLLISYMEARRIMNEQVEEKVHAALDVANGQIEKLLYQVQISTEDIAWLADRNFHSYKNDPDRYFKVTRDFVEAHPTVNSLAIAFEPNTFPGKGRYFAPFTFRSGDTLKTVQLGSPENEYFYSSWYQIPSMLKESRWIDPYTGLDKRYITSYSVPLMEGDKAYGVVVTDLDIGWISKKIDSLKILPDARTIMISADGHFVANSDPGMMKNTIYTAIMGIPDSAAIVDAARRMQAGQKGSLRLKAGKKWYHLYYAPMKLTGWSTGVFCPEKSVYMSTYRFFNILTMLSILGLALLYFLAKTIVNHYIKPIGEFAEASREIAKGKFDVPLPDSDYDDEISQMHDATDFMQKSLVEYIAKVKSATSAKERVESELRVAHDIQMGMVPKVFPPFPERSDIDIYATMDPAKEVGGDLYDFFIKDDKLHFMIGDVSGKGVPAALVMAVARSMFRTLASKNSDPGVIFTRMSDSMSESSSGMFVTAFAGIVDLKTGETDFCNAGHNIPIEVGPGKGQAKYLETIPNLPLCAEKGFQFQKQHMTLAKGSTLLLYTDGLNEAENDAKERFGKERLLAFLESEEVKTPKELVEDIMDAVHALVNGAPQSDDLTILAIKYTA